MDFNPSDCLFLSAQRQTRKTTHGISAVGLRYKKADSIFCSDVVAMIDSMSEVAENLPSAFDSRIRRSPPPRKQENKSP
jgi:hypothetical protein